jgi:4'-phosphopantetheinyl transferase
VFVIKDSIVNMVHVWLLRLDRDPLLVERYERVLSEDEMVRADRLRSFELRADFVYTRGVLRHILARYADNGLAPADLRFTYEDLGKPHLIDAHGGEDIGFNTSHSRDISVFAVATGRSVGVDVESIRPDYDHDVIAERWFARAENQMIRELPAEMRLQAFFATWSRKEALVKALGTGISHRLSSFIVSVHPDQPAEILETEWDASAKDEWGICDIPLEDGYAGALVASGKDWSPVFHDWTH